MQSLLDQLFLQRESKLEIDYLLNSLKRQELHLMRVMILCQQVKTWSYRFSVPLRDCQRVVR